MPALRACSLVSCIDRGVEIRGNFVVQVKHDGKPLPGVKIEIKTNRDAVEFTGLTGPDGKTTITKLPPGEYWLSVEFLGISAGYHCFHINRQPSKKAKRVMKYEWGDLAPGMRRVAGSIIDSQPGGGGTPLWNLTHRVTVPIAGAVLRLRNAISGQVFARISDEHGGFEFDSIPNGTYVLHESGATGRAYDPTDLLIKVRADGTRTAVVLSRQEPGATNCGDASLGPSWK
jgi:hypothetical protein